MRKLNLSDVTTLVGAPLKSGSVQHIQDSYFETNSAILESIAGLPVYSQNISLQVLRGCELIISGGNITGITLGYLVYDNEVFYSRPYTLPSPIPVAQSNVLGGTVVTAYFSGSNADPVTFTDSIARNIHEIREIQWDTLQGDFQYTDLLFPRQWRRIKNDAFFVYSPNEWSITSSQTDYYLDGGGMCHFISKQRVKRIVSTPLTQGFVIGFSLPFGIDQSDVPPPPNFNTEFGVMGWTTQVLQGADQAIFDYQTLVPCWLAEQSYSQTPPSPFYEVPFSFFNQSPQYPNFNSFVYCITSGHFRVDVNGY